MRRRLWVLGLLLSIVLTASAGWAGQTQQLFVGATATALSTELDAKGSNVWTLAGPILDNRIGQTGNGALICRVEATITFGANPTPGGAITGYFLKTVDGTNYEPAPTASISLNRAPDFVIPAVTGQAATRSMVDVRCPGERFKISVQNTATGQTTAASGNTVKVLFMSIQSN